MRDNKSKLVKWLKWIVVGKIGVVCDGGGGYCDRKVEG